METTVTVSTYDSLYSSWAKETEDPIALKGLINLLVLPIQIGISVHLIEFLFCNIYYAG